MSTNPSLDLVAHHFGYVVVKDDDMQKGDLLVHNDTLSVALRPIPQPFTVREARELNRLSSRWASRRATPKEIERCQALEMKKANLQKQGIDTVIHGGIRVGRKIA